MYVSHFTLSLTLYGDDQTVRRHPLFPSLPFPPASACCADLAGSICDVLGVRSAESWGEGEARRGQMYVCVGRGETPSFSLLSVFQSCCEQLNFL